MLKETPFYRTFLSGILSVWMAKCGCSILGLRRYLNGKVAKSRCNRRREVGVIQRLAGVLSKLGVKAVELGISMRAVFDEGLMISGDLLKIDIDATKKSVESSNSEAFALALNISYTTKETIKPLLQQAHQKAVALSVGAAIPTKDTIADIIRKANAEMTSISGAVEKAKPKAA